MKKQQPKATVFVAEDHPIARMGICESLKNAKNILLVGSVSPFLQKMGNPVSFWAKVSKYSEICLSGVQNMDKNTNHSKTGYCEGQNVSVCLSDTPLCLVDIAGYLEGEGHHRQISMGGACKPCSMDNTCNTSKGGSRCYKNNIHLILSVLY